MSGDKLGRAGKTHGSGASHGSISPSTAAATPRAINLPFSRTLNREIARAGVVGKETKQRARPIAVKPNCGKNGKGSVLSVPRRVPRDGLRLGPGRLADQGVRAQLEFPLESQGSSILESIIVDHWPID